METQFVTPEGCDSDAAERCCTGLAKSRQEQQGRDSTFSDRNLNEKWLTQVYRGAVPPKEARREIDILYPRLRRNLCPKSIGITEILHSFGAFSRKCVLAGLGSGASQALTKFHAILLTAIRPVSGRTQSGRRVADRYECILKGYLE